MHYHLMQTFGSLYSSTEAMTCAFRLQTGHQPHVDEVTSYELHSLVDSRDEHRYPLSSFAAVSFAARQPISRYQHSLYATLSRLTCLESDTRRFLH